MTARHSDQEADRLVRRAEIAGEEIGRFLAERLAREESTQFSLQSQGYTGPAFASGETQKSATLSRIEARWLAEQL